MQTDGAPLQVYPVSILQLLHPSELTVFLSSHCSVPVTLPSPHIGTRFSILHVDEQPSFEFKLPSSHSYPRATNLSPHFGVHCAPEGVNPCSEHAVHLVGLSHSEQPNGQA